MKTLKESIIDIHHDILDEIGYKKDNLPFLTPYEHRKIEEEVLSRFMPLIQPMIKEEKERLLREKMR